MLNGKSACFVSEGNDEELQRLINKEINITACMWGEGESMALGDVLALENEVASEYKNLADGLESARLKQERRAMRLVPENMSWVINDDVLEMSFELPAGTFATMVLRECILVKN